MGDQETIVSWLDEIIVRPHLVSNKDCITREIFKLVFGFSRVEFP